MRTFLLAAALLCMAQSPLVDLPDDLMVIWKMCAIPAKVIRLCAQQDGWREEEEFASDWLTVELYGIADVLVERGQSKEHAGALLRDLLAPFPIDYAKNCPGWYSIARECARTCSIDIDPPASP